MPPQITPCALAFSFLIHRVFAKTHLAPGTFGQRLWTEHGRQSEAALGQSHRVWTGRCPRVGFPQRKQVLLLRQKESDAEGI